MNTKRDKFIENQIKACKHAFKGFQFLKMFMPLDGKCWSCNRYIIDKLIDKGNNGNKVVTGCPFCHRSFCD